MFGNVTVLEAKLSVLCNWLAATVPSLGVPIETVSPKTKTKSTVSAESGASEKTMFVPFIEISYLVCHKQI